jgi:adenylate cyclase class IV
MPKEYEYAFINFDKEKIISKIKKLKGVYRGTFLFKTQQFNLPYNSILTPSLNIRVRDEGYRTTLTIKIPPLSNNAMDNFDDEYEVIIDNFDNGVNYLLSLGYTKKVYYEKIREIWNISNNFYKKYNTEIVFDTEYGISEIMEIESPTFEELEKMVKLFNIYT